MKRRILIIPLFLSFVGANMCQKADSSTSKPKSHPGCPGASKRSATSATACVCSKGEVLRAGALSCTSCDPESSSGDYCACDTGGVFSMNATIDTQLSLSSPQVQCSPEADCAQGTYSDHAGNCQTCAKGDCGDCGPCNVGETCVSGTCVAAAGCYVLEVAPPVSDAMQDASECDHAQQDVCRYGTIRTLPTGTRCECSADSAGCTYLGVALPVTANGECPGDSTKGKSGPCACATGQVLRAGALECDDCDPSGSKGSYCDCGKNSVFSMDATLDGYLNLTSPVAFCSDKGNCADGSYAGGDGQCVQCQAGDCGVCGPCNVGETCVSGKCVAAAGCRVRDVIPPLDPTDQTGQTTLDPKYCQYEVGAFCSFSFLRNAPTGSACSCDADYNDCTYQGKSEPLSQ
jgi:hypothetical protein